MSSTEHPDDQLQTRQDAGRSPGQHRATLRFTLALASLDLGLFLGRPFAAKTICKQDWQGHNALIPPDLIPMRPGTPCRLQVLYGLPVAFLIMKMWLGMCATRRALRHPLARTPSARPAGRCSFRQGQSVFSALPQRPGQTNSIVGGCYLFGFPQGLFRHLDCISFVLSMIDCSWNDYTKIPLRS